MVFITLPARIERHVWSMPWVSTLPIRSFIREGHIICNANILGSQMSKYFLR